MASRSLCAIRPREPQLVRAHARAESTIVCLRNDIDGVRAHVNAANAKRVLLVWHALWWSVGVCTFGRARVDMLSAEAFGGSDVALRLESI